jgi:hypothetical protein
MLFLKNKKREKWIEGTNIDVRLYDKGYEEWMTDIGFYDYKHDISYRKDLYKALGINRPLDFDFRYVLKKGMMENVYNERRFYSR